MHKLILMIILCPVIAFGQVDTTKLDLDLIDKKATIETIDNRTGFIEQTILKGKDFRKFVNKYFRKENGGRE